MPYRDPDKRRAYDRDYKRSARVGGCPTPGQTLVPLPFRLKTAADALKLLEEQVAAVRDVLEQIDAGRIPEILALNKWDLRDDVRRARVARTYRDGVRVSAVTGEGVEELVDRVAGALPQLPIEVTILVPFDRPEIVPRLYREAQVLSKQEVNEGVRVEARIGPAEFERIREFIERPVARRSRV